MDYSIYWQDIKDYSNYTSPHIQAVIAHGEACQVKFEIHRGEMVCYVNGQFTEAYKEWYSAQQSNYQKVSGE